MNEHLERTFGTIRATDRIHPRNGQQSDLRKTVFRYRTARAAAVGLVAGDRRGLRSMRLAALTQGAGLRGDQMTSTQHRHRLPSRPKRRQFPNIRRAALGKVDRLRGRVEILRRGPRRQPRQSADRSRYHQSRRAERFGQDDVDESDDRAAQADAGARYASSACRRTNPRLSFSSSVTARSSTRSRVERRHANLSNSICAFTATRNSRPTS